MSWPAGHRDWSALNLQNVVNEAALLAARKNREHPTYIWKTFWEAMDKIVLGAERKIMLGEDYRRVIAVHESGHALIAKIACPMPTPCAR